MFSRGFVLTIAVIRFVQQRVVLKATLQFVVNLERLGDATTLEYTDAEAVDVANGPMVVAFWNDRHVIALRERHYRCVDDRSVALVD
jgi:hypothetical protein